MRKSLVVLLLAGLAGCASLLVSEWDQLYGPQDPARYDRPVPPGDLSFDDDIQPILNRRCVVCHACYDAPCQLKMESWEGLTRGASSTRVYKAERLLAIQPTRLGVDASSNREWRDKGFFPVLNERGNTTVANLNASVMTQMLLQKTQHPLPSQSRLPDSFELGLNRAMQCTRIEKFDRYKSDYPLWGMPYGLPGLNQEEQATLLSWLEQGAPGPAPFVLDDELQQQIQQQIAQWETFLNQGTDKSKLVSRYLYEHLYPAHLYFGGSDENAGSANPVYFELVRSRTPAPEKIDIIATRFPFSDPGSGEVYYRLRPLNEAIVNKTHMPYRLDDARMTRWREWFFDTDYSVTELPGYKIEQSSNPFATFGALPIQSRYRFMLEEAHYTIMGFIKGPVCRGQVALNVINDHFWVTFVDPDYQSNRFDADFLSQHVNRLEMPAASDANAGLLNWMGYARKERQYLEARAHYLNDRVDQGYVTLDLDLLWDGDGHNDNAALTVYRHFDSASVIKGLHGGLPQTGWVISYPLLERIHYLLVAGFDVFGNVGHQLNTRIYMDFLRMEGEFNFMMLLPKNYRPAVYNQWYRGDLQAVHQSLYDYSTLFQGETAITYDTDTPLQELYRKLQDRLEPVLDHRWEFEAGLPGKKIIDPLDRLDRVLGLAASLMPQNSVLRIRDNDKATYYSILSNSRYTNITHLFDEADRRLPAEDTLTVSYGVMGAYPNVFFDVAADSLEDFANRVTALQSADDFTRLMDSYGIRRTSPHFWTFSDQLHRWMKDEFPDNAGILDYNRLENK